MNIAILGAGNVGGALGKLWAAQGHRVTFGVPDPTGAKTQSLVKSIGGQVQARNVMDAAASAGVVVLATPWPATQDAVRAAGDLTGKIVIDCTNPLAADLSGLVTGTSNSAAEEVARWAKGAKVVKAFNTIGADNFGKPKYGAEAASMFICGDDAAAKSQAGGLAAELGFDVVDVGPLTEARSLEALAMLWIHLAINQGWGPAGHAFKLLRR